jgi:hypothetical protein
MNLSTIFEKRETNIPKTVEKNVRDELYHADDN